MDPLYRAFITVVESSTLVQAAERLHVTQPTLTRQIQQLEAQLKHRLFDRLGKRLVINRAGELAYEFAKRCKELENRLYDELQSQSDPEVGTIYVGAGLTTSIYLLPPLLAAYKQAHPNVRFLVRTGSSRETLMLLRNRDVDLAVVTTLDANRTDVDAASLIDDPLLLVTRATEPVTASVSLIPFGQLANIPIVVLREGSGLRDLIFDLAAEHGVRLSVAAETDSLESISRLVQQGMGVSILPASAVREDIAQGRLVEVRTDVPLPSRTIQLVTPTDRVLPAVATQFTSYLVSGSLAMQTLVTK